MNTFESIDEKLREFASNHNTQVESKGSIFWIENLQVPADKIQERRICWIDGVIRKAILIQPNFVSNDLDKPLWDFEILAWLEKKEINSSKPFWKKYLFKKVEFIEIEKSIDGLLSQSAKNLEAIELKDLY